MLPAVFARPFAIVRSEILTVLPLLTAKIRNEGVPSAVLRWTVSRLAPGPVRVMSLARAGSADKRLIVVGPEAVSEALNVICSAPAAALAAVIASRNVQPLPEPASVHAPSLVSAVEFTS